MHISRTFLKPVGGSCAHSVLEKTRISHPGCCYMLNFPLVWRQGKMIPWLYSITGGSFPLLCHSSPALQVCSSSCRWDALLAVTTDMSSAKKKLFWEEMGKGGRLEGWWAAAWERKPILPLRETFLICQQLPVFTVAEEAKTYWTKQGNGMLWHRSRTSPWKLLLPQVSASSHPEPTQPTPPPHPPRAVAYGVQGTEICFSHTLLSPCLALLVPMSF